MGQTLTEKLLARAAGKTVVHPGEYIELKEFVGPIGYSFKGFNFIQTVQRQLAALGVEKIACPERCILNCDHNTPAQTQADTGLVRQVKAAAAELGIDKVYDREGIGHIVNIETGDILPGSVFVHMDPQSALAGGIGAPYTNGGRLGSTYLEAFALGELTICVPETLRIEINGNPPPNVSARDMWFKILNDIGPDAAHAMVIEFTGSAIDQMPVEQRLVLCGSVGFAGADSAVIRSDEVTALWFRENFGIHVETLDSDPDASFARTITYDASSFVPMLTYPPEIFYAKPVEEFAGIKIDQCVLGTCAGGNLSDLRNAAEILKGKKIHRDVRMLVSPATQLIYIKASLEGLMATLAEAGAVILPPTCDVCLGVIGPLSDGEVCLSQQTLNVPGRSGSAKADIYLASAATIAASAVCGRISVPPAGDSVGEV